MSNQTTSLSNAMALNGGIEVNGAGTYTIPSDIAAQTQYNVIGALNGSLVISAIVGSRIPYSAILPITLQDGRVLYVPGATSFTITSGQGYASYI